jgi:hypothetical protein
MPSAGSIPPVASYNPGGQPSGCRAAASAPLPGKRHSAGEPRRRRAVWVRKGRKVQWLRVDSGP